MAKKTKQATSPISRAELKKEILAGMPKDSPLRGFVDELISSAVSEHVDPRLLAAISGAETSFATDPNAGEDIRSGHNPFGMGPHIRYGSWAEGFKAAAHNLNENYFGERSKAFPQGRHSIQEIGAKWAPVGPNVTNDPNHTNSGWAANVEAFYRRLGGDPASGLMFHGNVAALSAGQQPLSPDAPATVPVEQQQQQGQDERSAIIAKLLQPSVQGTNVQSTIQQAPQQGGLGQSPQGQTEGLAIPPPSDEAQPAPSVGGLNSMLAERFSQLQSAVRQAGGDLKIYSGARDKIQQAQLYADAMAKYGSEQAAKKWYADPEKSHHNPDSGMRYGVGNGAVGADVRGDMELAHELAPRFGLTFPLKMQPWHVEIAGLKDMKPAS